mgnify:CR=1 FL=1
MKLLIFTLLILCSCINQSTQELDLPSGTYILKSKLLKSSPRYNHLDVTYKISFSKNKFIYHKPNGSSIWIADHNTGKPKCIARIFTTKYSGTFENINGDIVLRDLKGEIIEKNQFIFKNKKLLLVNKTLKQLDRI